jgi:hypothetical protein
VLSFLPSFFNVNQWAFTLALYAGAHFVSGLRPGLHSAIHELRLSESFADILRGLTDSGAVIGSGAVKDDLLIFRQSGQP